MTKAEELLNAMKVEVDNDDYEIAHVNADVYLIEAIKELIKERGDKEIWTELLGAYRMVNKWYA